jgi:hypothetical protein
VDDLDHDLIRADVDDVDWEEHERRVNRPAWTQDDPFSWTELAFTQETAQAPERGVGDQDALADDATIVLTAKN